MIDPALVPVLTSLQARVLRGEPREHLVATAAWALGLPKEQANELIPAGAVNITEDEPGVTRMDAAQVRMCGVLAALRLDCEKPIRDESGKFLGCEPGGGDGAAGGGGGGGASAGSGGGGSAGSDDGPDEGAMRREASKKARAAGVYKEHPAAKKVAAHAEKAKQHAAEAKAHFAAAGKAVLDQAGAMNAHVDELKALSESVEWSDDKVDYNSDDVNPVDVYAPDLGMDEEAEKPEREPLPRVEPPKPASEYASPKEREKAVDAFLAGRKKVAEAMLAKIDEIEKAHNPKAYKPAGDALKEFSSALSAHEKAAKAASQEAEKVDASDPEAYDKFLGKDVPRPNDDGEFASDEAQDAYEEAVSHFEAHAEEIQEEAYAIGSDDGLGDIDVESVKETIKDAKKKSSETVSSAKRLRPLLKRELAKLDKERARLLSDEDPPEDEEDDTDEPEPEAEEPEAEDEE